MSPVPDWLVGEGGGGSGRASQSSIGGKAAPREGVGGTNGGTVVGGGTSLVNGLCWGWGLEMANGDPGRFEVGSGWGGASSQSAAVGVWLGEVAGDPRRSFKGGGGGAEKRRVGLGASAIGQSAARGDGGWDSCSLGGIWRWSKVQESPSDMEGLGLGALWWSPAPGGRWRWDG